MALSEKKRIRHRAYMRLYRAKHPGRIKAIRLRYKQRHLDRIQRSQRLDGLLHCPKRHDRLRFNGNRKVALERDGYQCCLCHMTQEEHLQRFGRGLTVDHKDGHGRYASVKNHALENLWTLCLPCHGRKDGVLSSTYYGGRG